MRTFAVVTAIALGLVAAGASAQAIDDAQIAHIVVTANQVDIDAGKLAASTATSPEVKKFGQQMVTDHTAAGNQLSEIAAQEQYPCLPRLSRLSSKISSRSNSSAIRNSVGPISTCKWSTT